MTKKSRQKLKYLEYERALEVKYKAFFIIFKGLSVDKSCLRTESAPLTIFSKGSIVNVQLDFKCASADLSGSIQNRVKNKPNLISELMMLI